LALRELGVVDFAGGFAMPDSVSVPRRIEDQYLTRLRGLRVTQRLLLVAAADPVGDTCKRLSPPIPLYHSRRTRRTLRGGSSWGAAQFDSAVSTASRGVAETADAQW